MLRKSLRKNWCPNFKLRQINFHSSGPKIAKYGLMIAAFHVFSAPAGTELGTGQDGWGGTHQGKKK